MDIEKLLLLLDAAIKEFYVKDEYLIQERVHERTCVARIAHYLQNMLDKDEAWRDLNADCEYNRQVPDEKLSDSCVCEESEYEMYSVYPDLIVHHRGYNDKNLLVVEFKHACNDSEKNRKKDIGKIKDMIKDPQKHYMMGVYVCLGRQRYTFQILR